MDACKVGGAVAYVLTPNVQNLRLTQLSSKSMHTAELYKARTGKAGCAEKEPNALTRCKAGGLFRG